MSRRFSSFGKRIVVCFLIAVVMLSFTAVPAYAVESRASDYLESYTSYICAMGDGELQIWFRVTGSDDWADLGVLTIRLYESSDGANWTWVKTFRHTSYQQMLGHDTGHVMSYVSYEGTPGKYYKAYVTIWAGDADNNGDTRYFWTDPELCV